MPEEWEPVSPCCSSIILVKFCQEEVSLVLLFSIFKTFAVCIPRVVGPEHFVCLIDKPLLQSDFIKVKGIDHYGLS